MDILDVTPLVLRLLMLILISGDLTGCLYRRGRETFRTTFKEEIRLNATRIPAFAFVLAVLVYMDIYASNGYLVFDILIFIVMYIFLLQPKYYGLDDSGFYAFGIRIPWSSVKITRVKKDKIIIKTLFITYEIPVRRQFMNYLKKSSPTYLADEE